MTNKEYIKNFTEEMEKILKEKYKKYKDGWKETNIYELRRLLNKQFSKLTIYNDYENNRKHLEETKRKLIHITNYCLFIYTILEKRYNTFIYCEKCGHKSYIYGFKFIEFQNIADTKYGLIERFAIIKCPNCNTKRKELL